MARFESARADSCSSGLWLTLGIETVKTHVKRIFMKLGMRDRAQAVVAAYESGSSCQAPEFRGASGCDSQRRAGSETRWTSTSTNPRSRICFNARCSVA
jgi:hypothetical protein